MLKTETHSLEIHSTTRASEKISILASALNNNLHNRDSVYRQIM